MGWRDERRVLANLEVFAVCYFMVFTHDHRFSARANATTLCAVSFALAMSTVAAGTAAR